MNWQVLEASNREIVEAYVEAVKSRDVDRIRFWRSVLDDRLVLIYGNVTAYYRNHGGDRPANKSQR